MLEKPPGQGSLVTQTCPLLPFVVSVVLKEIFPAYSDPFRPTSSATTSAATRRIGDTDDSEHIREDIGRLCVGRPAPA